MQVPLGIVPLPHPLACFIQSFTWCFSENIYMYVQFILSQGVHIYEFTFSLNVFVTPKSKLTVLSRSFEDIHRVVKNLNHLMSTFPVEVKQGNCFTFLSHLLYCKQVSFGVVYLVLLYFSNFCSFCWQFYCLKQSPKCSADVLSNVLKSQKTVLYLTEKTYMLDKLHSGVICTAVDASILNKLSLNKNTQNRLCIDSLMKIQLQAHRNLILYFSLGSMFQYSLTQCLWQLYRT